MKENVKLIICLKVCSLIPKNIEFVYTRMNLNNIDEFTYPFQNEEDFFNNNKSAIFYEVRKKANFYDIDIDPTDIYLNTDVKNSIFLLKRDKKVKALFQNIKCGNKEYLLEELVKSRLKNNMLRVLYIFDERGMKDTNYESIFKSCDNRVYALIKGDLIEDKVVDYIWTFFKTKNRFYAILRFILSSGDEYILWNIYTKTISLKENYDERAYVRSRKSKKYWYQDD